jgi:hypothetical protein
MVALGAVGTAQAQSMSGGGTVTYIPAHQEKMELADGTLMVRQMMKGVVVAEDASVPFHMSPQDCMGSNIIGGDGMLIAGYGHCRGMDADGDVWFIWYKNSPEGNHWGFMGGRGKYEGIEGGGTTVANPPTADGRLVITWEGTWTMK